MNVQVIMRDGQPEYAVLPWNEYQALLQAAGHNPSMAAKAVPRAPTELVALASLTRLSALREAKAMSVEQLAKAVGVSPHYLALIEQGERDPGPVIERALAQVLGITGWEAEH